MMALIVTLVLTVIVFGIIVSPFFRSGGSGPAEPAAPPRASSGKRKPATGGEDELEARIRSRRRRPPRFCPNCGEPVKEGDRFCTGCGTRLGEDGE